MVTTFISNDGCGLNSVAVQGDGRIVVAGYRDDGHNKDIALLRYNSGGTLDGSFGIGGFVITDINDSDNDDVAFSVKVQQNGKILVAGYADNGHNKNFVLVRYNPDGTLDGTFGGYDTDPVIGPHFHFSHHVSGVVVTDFFGTSDDNFAYDMGIDAHGDIVLAGSAVNSGDPSQPAMARYKGDPIPRLTVEQPAGSALATGATVDFGTTLIGGAHSRVFTLRNSGNSVLTLSGAGILPPASGSGAGNFSIISGSGSVHLGADQSTTIKVAFTPDGAGAFNATLRITSDSTTGGTFDIALTGAGTTLTKTFTSGADPGFDTEGLTISGQNANVSLGFAPSVGWQLKLVDNSITGAINGRYSNMLDHAPISLAFAGTNYGFFADYEGGDGNDLVLTCFGTMPDPSPPAALAFWDFASTAGIALFGDAVKAGNVIRLTPPIEEQSGWAWSLHKLELTNGFITRFVCRFDPQGGVGADGVSFSVQNVGNEVAASEYGQPLGIQLNTWYNTGEASDNSVEVHGTNGLLASADLTPLGIHLKDALPHEVVIAHDGMNLNLLVDGIAVFSNLPIPLSTFMDADGYGWAGFGSRCGGAYEAQDLLSWQMYLNNPGPKPYAVDPLPDSTLMGVEFGINYFGAGQSVLVAGRLQVTPGVEVPDHKYDTIHPGDPTYSLDVGGDTIRIFGFQNYSGYPGSALFPAPYGVRIRLEHPGPVISQVTVDAANNLSGFSNSRITFTGDTIFLDYQGLPYNANTVIALKVKTVPANYTNVLNPANGHYYTFVRQSAWWADAKTGAEAYSFPGYHSTLATITSPEEQAFVMQQFGVNFGPEFGVSPVWIGGRQPDGSLEPGGNFQWVTGEPFGYSNWGPSEPDNQLGSENVIEIRRDGLWNDLVGNAQFPSGGFLIESAPFPPLLLVSPAPITVSGNSLHVNFTLYGPAPDSPVHLNFIKGTTTNVLSLSRAHDWQGSHTFDFDAANPTGSGEIQLGQPIPNGNYSVSISYTDIWGIAHSSALNVGMAIDAESNVIIVDGSFEAIGLAPGSYQLNPPGSAWTFHYNSGLVNPPSIFSAPDAPFGSQMAFLQTDPWTNGFGGVFSQSFTLARTGGYALSYFDAGPNYGSYYVGDVPYQVLLDGLPIVSNQTTTSGQPFTPHTFQFSADAGTHTLTFRVDPAQPPGDNVAFFDGIVINPLGPDATLHDYPDGTRLRLVVSRDPSRNNVNLVAEAAYELAGPWSPLATSTLGAPFIGPGYVSGDDTTPGVKTVVIRDTLSVSDAPRRFLRVRETP